MSKKPIAKIGFGLPYNTPHRATGYCAAEMAIEEANARGDLPFELELHLNNDERNVERAHIVATEFCEDPAAVGMLGPLNSPMSHASQHIYNKYGMAQISSEPISPSLTEKGYKNYFRLLCRGDYYAEWQARVAIEYLKARNIAVISDGNPERYGPISDAFCAKCAALGVEPAIVWTLGEREKQYNFDEMVDAFVKVQPDLVFFAAYWDPSHVIAHQLRYKHCSGVFLGTDALKHIPYLEVYGLDPTPPMHTFNGVDVRLAPSCKEFFQKFAIKYPHTLVNLQYAPEGYDMANMMIEALRRANKIDRGAVLEEFQKMAVEGYQGLIGNIRFDEKGDLIDPPLSLYRCEESLRYYIGDLRNLLKN